MGLITGQYGYDERLQPFGLIRVQLFYNHKQPLTSKREVIY